MADTVISLDADTTAADRKLKTLRGEAAKVGENYAKGFAQAVVGAGALVMLARKAFDASEQFKKSQGEVAKQIGSTVLRLSLAQSKMGMGPGAAAPTAQILAGGTRTREEGVGFVEALQQKYGKTLTEQQQNDALQAFMSGTYDQAEAIDMARRGGFDVAGRTKSLPQLAQQELATRAAEKRSAMATETKLADNAASEREINSMVEELNRRGGWRTAITPDFMLRKEAEYAQGQRGVLQSFAAGTGDTPVQQTLREILAELRRPATGERK